MRRDGRLGIATAASGVALSLALAGTLQALPTASVVSEGNRVESGRYRGALLRAALVDEVTDCRHATLTTDPLPPLVLGDVDLEDLAWTQSSGVLCIEHHDDGPRPLATLVEAVVDAERGRCRLAEVVSGDDSCGDGEDGELDDIVVLRLEPVAGPCAVAAGSFTAMRAGVVVAPSLPPATRCALRLVASIDPDAARDARGRAAGDVLEWRQAFVLDEADGSDDTDSTDSGSPTTTESGRA